MVIFSKPINMGVCIILVFYIKNFKVVGAFINNFKKSFYFAKSRSLDPVSGSSKAINKGRYNGPTYPRLIYIKPVIAIPYSEKPGFFFN